ncbi:MAG: LytR/AlgR family response regulator transcription factor [Terriglobales bacterium]
MKIRALIVDDEPLARERIRSLLLDESDIELSGEFENGSKAVDAIRQDAPDLLFLDVQMPELDGFGVLQAIGPDRVPAVIFVTAYDEYALRAFDANAMDYLLKPFDQERFRRSLDRARSHLQLDRASRVNDKLQSLMRYLNIDPNQLGQLPQSPAAPPATASTQGNGHSHASHSDRLVVKSGGRVYFLKSDEIDWVEAAGNYVRLHVSKDSHLLRETMNGIETKLDTRHFMRIHRSTIVNLERIKELQPWFHGDYVVLLRDGTRLTLSRGYREKLQQVMGSHF